MKQYCQCTEETRKVTGIIIDKDDEFIYMCNGCQLEILDKQRKKEKMMAWPKARKRSLVERDNALDFLAKLYDQERQL